VIIVVAVVFMNIVTAVIVNSALEQAAEQKEAKAFFDAQKKKRLTRQLDGMFMRMDVEKKGIIERNHILAASDADKQTLLEYMEMENPVHVFDQLDVDGNGKLDRDEFLEGLTHCALTKTPIELKRIDKRVRILKRHQDTMAKTLQAIHESILALHVGLQQLQVFTDRTSMVEGANSLISQSASYKERVVDSHIPDLANGRLFSNSPVHCGAEKLDPVSQQLKKLAEQVETDLRMQDGVGSRQPPSTSFPMPTQVSETGCRAMPSTLASKPVCLNSLSLSFEHGGQQRHEHHKFDPPQDACFNARGTLDHFGQPNNDSSSQFIC